MPPPLHHRTLAQHARALRAGDYTSLDLTHHYLSRARAAAPLNAFITLTDTAALAEAEAADRRLQAGDPAPLLGIPIAHKDLFCTTGTLTTCASKSLANFIAPYDATVVHRLRQHGMVTIGKTNMDEFAMGSSTETSHYGPTLNPWDPTRVPGGSSGGSAAAVAAGLTPAATGTDTGGSIRQPAALCGLTGIKPSYGRVSRHGMIAFASSLDQAGLLTRTAEDAALLLHAIAGHDPNDSTSLQLPAPDYPALLALDLTGLTIGLPKEIFADTADLNPHLVAALTQAIDHLKTLGATTVEVTLPNTTASIPCYYVIAPAEASSNLARYDGVRYGHRTADPEDLTDMYTRTRAEGFGLEVQRRIMIGTYVLSAGYYDAYYRKAQQLRRLIADDHQTAFQHCHLIAGPTTPTPAFRLGEKTADPIAMYQNDLFTNAANLAGLPSLSLPIGFTPDHLPLAMQLTAPYLDEAVLLRTAHHYQQTTDWHHRTPPASQ